MNFGKLKRWLNNISLDETEGYLMTVITIILVIDVLLGILARFVHFESVFATELGKYLFIWLCLLGISAAAKDNQHIRISFIVEKLPVSPKITWILSQVIFLIFSILFFYVSLRLTWMHFTMKKSAVGFDFPMYIFTAALPVGFLLTSLRLMKDIFSNSGKSGMNRWDINQSLIKDPEEQDPTMDMKRN
jgi:TRAP-type C4-dicarboxylate transport system permease small subunit